jgi:hypothetical protein
MSDKTGSYGSSMFPPRQSGKATPESASAQAQRNGMTGGEGHEPRRSAPPAQRGTGLLAWLVGIFAAPAAWVGQTCISEALAAQGCDPYTGGLGVASSMRWASAAVVVLSVVCFMLGAVGTLVAWRNWRRNGDAVRYATAPSTPTSGSDAGRVMPPRWAERDWFLARVGALSSTLFLFALIATDVAVVVVAPCRTW